jgi:hypothetical protein
LNLIIYRIMQKYLESTPKHAPPDADNDSTPEMALFLACARSCFDPAASQAIRQLLQSPIQWPHFLDLSRRHGLLSYVKTALTSQKDAVPDEIRATLRNGNRHFTMHALLLTSELVRLTQHLTDTNIKVIAYKGPALAQILYGNAGKRHFNDLDFLIDEPDLPRVRETLLSQGYRSRLELEWEHSFDRDDTRIHVDIHWAFVRQSLRFNLPFDDVWQRRQMLTIGGESITTLGNEDTLIVQCINAAKDDWVSLAQIFEIGQMISAYDLDWKVLSEQAKRVGCRRLVLIGLSLASQLFSAPIPVSASEVLAIDKSVEQLGAEIVGRWILPPEATSSKFMYLDRLRARSRERLRERLPYYLPMLKYILTPTKNDFEVLPLPRLLFPLYFIIRPIRLTRKYASTNFHSGRKDT